MPASFPAGFDVMLEPGGSLSGPPLHDSLHLQITDILAAIEAELGLSPSGTDATVAATLAALPTRYLSSTPVAWNTPSLSGAWVNYGAPFQVCQYRKVLDEVELRGVIKTGAIGTSFLTLPAGNRPPASLNLPCASNAAFGMLTIAADGTCVAAVGNNTYVSFDVLFSVTA